MKLGFATAIFTTLSLFNTARADWSSDLAAATEITHEFADAVANWTESAASDAFNTAQGLFPKFYSAINTLANDVPSSKQSDVDSDQLRHFAGNISNLVSVKPGKGARKGGGVVTAVDRSIYQSDVLASAGPLGSLFTGLEKLLHDDCTVINGIEDVVGDIYSGIKSLFSDIGLNLPNLPSLKCPL